MAEHQQQALTNSRLSSLHPSRNPRAPTADATGSNNSIQHTNVILEISQVLSSLLKNPDRTFVMVEQEFFQRWYQSASSQDIALMEQVVASGQMTFINGGACMHDEASPTYVDMVDQTALGHRFIAQEFGASAIPKVTWQIGEQLVALRVTMRAAWTAAVKSLRLAAVAVATCVSCGYDSARIAPLSPITSHRTWSPPPSPPPDPFGHSATQSALFSSQLSGFSAIFFGRIDFADRALRQNETRLEHIWRASHSLGANAQTFTDVMPGYGPPNNFCFDEVACGGNFAPVQDDPLLNDYNVDMWINMTVTEARSWAANYVFDTDNTSHVLWTMGSDFECACCA